jgi:hypothetical protein
MDITGPDDLPGLLVNFVEDLPIVGEFVALMKSIISGDATVDDVLDAIKNMFDTLGEMLGLTSPDFDPSTFSELFAAAIEVVDQVARDLIQNVIDAIREALTGLSETGVALEQMFYALQHIPGNAVLGIGGPADIGQTMQSTWDYLVSGFVGALGSDSGLADLFNISQDVSSRATLGQWSWDILGLRSKYTFSGGMLPTEHSAVPLTQVGAGASATTTSVTTNSLIGWHIFPENMPLGVITWLGSGVSSISDFRVIVWQIYPDGSTQVIHTSANINGLLSGSMQYNVYELPVPLDVVGGDILGAELIAIGGGTHSVATTPTWLPEHPNALPKRMAARRSDATLRPPSGLPLLANGDIFKDQFGFEDDLLWTGFGTHVVVGSGVLTLTPQLGYSGSILTSVESFDAAANDTDFLVEVPTAVSNTALMHFRVFSVADSTDYWEIVKTGANLDFQEFDNGANVSVTTVTYNGTTHRWWRIRLNGSTITWDTSPNGIDWTQQKSKTSAGGSLADVRVAFYAGYTGSEPSPGTAVFDNFNAASAAGFTSTTDIPSIGWAVETGPGTTYHSPEVHEFSSNASYPIPAWANHVDVVSLGGGGGSADGSSFGTQYGDGGAAGSFGTATRDRGTHFSGSVTAVITVGAGGVNSGSSGTAGGASTATIAGYTVTGVGGAGGVGQNAATSARFGDGPYDTTFNGQIYHGGGDQTTPSKKGVAPGGGASGGYVWDDIQGESGAAGRVWLRFYQ